MTDPALTPPVSQQAPAGERALKPGSAAQDRARKTAEEFEAFFLAQVLNQMFAGIPTDGPFGGGAGEGVFRSMLNDKYAKIISRSGGVGIADAVYREILKLQESKP